MSTLQRINFELISDLIPVVRRNYPLADRTLVDPANANTLIDGEWIVINDSSKAVRATDISTDGAKALNDGKRVRSYLWFSERGRTDSQVLGSGPLLVAGWFEANTRVFDASAKATGDAATQYPAITYVGQPLQVATITVGGRKLSGLVGADVDQFTTNMPFIVGWVTRLPANNGGKLRFCREYCR